MSRCALDRLSESLVGFAQDVLESGGGFRPFGATVDVQGHLQFYAAEEDPDKPDYRNHIEALKQCFRAESDKGRIDAVGLCFDVILHREGKPNQDAIQCILEHVDGDAIECLIPYSKTGSGAVRFEERSIADRAPEFFGSAGLVLTLEGKEPVRSPTVAQLGAAVASLTPRGGPGFLILESATQDYAQAAGGDGQYTAEWREYLNGEFRHWVAGRGEKAVEHSVEIKTNGCVVTVRKNEVLAEEDVRTILVSFAQGKGRPAQYLWRETTTDFLRDERQ
jgi:hypothetical protein